MNPERRLKEIGLDASHIVYLCGMARDIYQPSAFDEEVQGWLNWLSQLESEVPDE